MISFKQFLNQATLDEGILKPYHAAAKQPWSKTVKDSKGTAGEHKQISKGKDFTVWTAYRGSNKSQPHYVVRDDKVIGSGMTHNSALKDAGLKDKDVTHRSKFADGSILNKGMKESTEIEEGSETWEAGYKRRVVKTTKPEHKEKGYNWRIKGKDRPEISIKLYKEKPSQSEFNKQMRRVAGHEFGG